MHPIGAADAHWRAASLFSVLFQLPTPNFGLTLKKNVIFPPDCAYECEELTGLWDGEDCTCWPWRGGFPCPCLRRDIEALSS